MNRKTTTVAPPAAAIASVLLALFGRKVGGVDTSTVGTYLAAAIGGLLAHRHIPPIARKVRRKPRPPRKPFTMLDSITVDPLRGVASTRGEAVAGYVDGRWPDFRAMAAAYPRDRHLSIAVRFEDDADCADFENGNGFTLSNIALWVQRQHRRGNPRPWVYADRSNWPMVAIALANGFIGRDQYVRWIAHWTYQPHIPAGGDACQWTNRYQGRNLDASLVSPTAFDR